MIDKFIKWLSKAPDLQAGFRGSALGANLLERGGEKDKHSLRVKYLEKIEDPGTRVQRAAGHTP